MFGFNTFAQAPFSSLPWNNYAVTIAESMAATENISPAGSIYNVTLFTSLTASDEFIAGYLWTPVNDGQVADWVGINNTQAAAWANVDDSQTINWQNINNTQAPSWGNVDDEQTPDWNPVLP